MRPWRLYRNYALDIVSLRHGKIDDGVMRSVRPELFRF
jgi:monooxygenase